MESTITELQETIKSLVVRVTQLEGMSQSVKRLERAWIEVCFGSLSCMNLWSVPYMSVTKGRRVRSRMSVYSHLSIMPSKMHIPVLPCRLIPAQTFTFGGCLGLQWVCMYGGKWWALNRTTTRRLHYRSLQIRCQKKLYIIVGSTYQGGDSFSASGSIH